MKLDVLRQANPPVEALVQEHGPAAVADELEEMCYHDMADVAMSLAVKIGDIRVARIGADIVLKSGSYPEAAHEQARGIMGRR